MNPTLTVDDLQFEVRRSPRRKTLQITVDRCGELILSAPEGSDPEVMEEFVREKRFWLYAKLAEKEALQRPVATKEFMSGEGFPYLGRSHRLLLVDHQDVPLKLERRRFRLLRSEADNGRLHFIRWYTEHARVWLQKSVRPLALRVGVEPCSVHVRDLGFRWGSCGARGTLNFHWATIVLPPNVIEYVVCHELVHLHEPRHTPDFWRRLERAMPDYENRKRWIAEHGMAFAAL
jgi:predicted metal-dependent hydrolase